MLKRKKPRPMGVRNQKKKSFPKHLQWVRGFECAVRDDECWGKTQAHHVREQWENAMGTKPPDFHVVPLCTAHHTELHTKGRLTFQRKHGGIDLINIARDLAHRSPHKKDWEDG